MPTAQTNFAPPKGLLPIYCLFLINTVTFGLFYSSLSLLLTQQFDLPALTAVGLVGIFFAFHYTLTIIGGKIGDRYIDFKILFTCGKFFQLASSLVLLLALNNIQLLFFGLSLFLVDSMVSTVSLNMFITDHFKQRNEKDRLMAFLSTHIWSNIGFITAFLVSGALYHFFSIDKLLYVTAFFSALTAICSIFIVPYGSRHEAFHATKYPYIKTILFMCGMSFVLTLILRNFHFSRGIIFIAAGALLLILLLTASFKVEKSEARNVGSFAVFMVCSLGFWSIYMLGPTFMPLFIDREVDTMIFGLEIPPQWIQIIGPMMAVSGGNILKAVLNFLAEKRNFRLSHQMHFMLALGFASFALLILIYGLNSAANNLLITFSWIVLNIVMLEIGELFLVPSSKALVGSLIPKKFQGLCTGINQLTIGISVMLAGLISETYLIRSDSTDSPINNYTIYTEVFGCLIIIAIAIIVFMYLFDRFLKKALIPPKGML